MYRRVLLGLLPLLFVMAIGIVYAGSLAPSASPGATSYTLSDIYARLTTNATTTSGNHDFSPSGSPSGSMYSLTDIYQAIPTISGSKVLRGTTYLGIGGRAYGGTSSGSVAATATASGILLWNQFNGSGLATGGSQADGGMDLGSGQYQCPMGWVQCVAGNNYCGTGLTSADAKDNCTGLVWSYPCSGSGCAVFNNTTLSIYSADASYRNNSSKTAAQLCSSGTHGQSGWFLPHQIQVMQAFIDGWWIHLLNSTISSPYAYWTATSATPTTVGYRVEPWGAVVLTTKTGTYFVRCVRPAL